MVWLNNNSAEQVCGRERRLKSVALVPYQTVHHGTNIRSFCQCRFSNVLHSNIQSLPQHASRSSLQNTVAALRFKTGMVRSTGS